MALTEEQKKRNRIIRANKKMTSEELANAMHNHWGVSNEDLAQVIDRVRSQIKDNREWYDVYRWCVERGDTETKSWASIYSQSYGYNYTTHYILDTGYNQYETTVFNSEGWYTE